MESASINTMFSYCLSATAVLIVLRKVAASASSLAKAITAWKFHPTALSRRMLIVRVKSVAVTGVILPVPGSDSKRKRRAGESDKTVESPPSVTSFEVVLFCRTSFL